MGAITTLTRMWLTRSVKPFTFLREADAVLHYEACQGLGLYVHIPFCRTLCSFCPYCKTIFDKKTCDRYIDHLLQEIRMVGSQQQGKKTVTSLYFGGGTPALAADRLGEIIETLQQYFTITQGIGVELHPDNVTVPVLQTLKAAGVTKLSIGIQSFQSRHQKTLGRTAADPAALSQALAAVSFETVSMDFIFALPEQTPEDLQADLQTAFTCGANHVAIYPFIDFTFTGSSIPAMNKRQKRALLDAITVWCAQQGLHRDSIWTFSKSAQARYSSMTRDNFLGFGCSATTLLYDQFKINTFDVDSYCRCISEGHLPTALTLRFTERQRMVYYLFWTAYSTRVHSDDFFRFFGVPLERMYGAELLLARLLGFVRLRDGCYEMTTKGAFYYHHYENYYTLAYIDRMWSILRKEAFPKKLLL